MKVSRSLESYWQRQNKFELQLQKEAESRRVFLKQEKKHELEIVLYERHVQKLQMVQARTKGKNVDSLT